MKKLTAEQERKRDERRARFKALVKRVADMQPLERDALAAKMLGVVTCEGRALSTHNACLIAFQNPSATLVGGFRQWIKQGRAVRKGEHGLMIWVPKMLGATKSVDGDGQENKDGEKVGFLIGTVFDVSQTDAIGETVAERVQVEPMMEMERAA